MEKDKDNAGINLGGKQQEQKLDENKTPVNPQSEQEQKLDENKQQEETPYIVRITVPALNVRMRPEKTAKILSVLTDQTEDLMITAESGTLGELTWGKLDGGGWVQLGFTEKVN